MKRNRIYTAQDVREIAERCQRDPASLTREESRLLALYVTKAMSAARPRTVPTASVLDEFISMAAALRAGNKTTSLEILARLESDPRIQPPPTADPTKPKPQTRPHASRAIRKAMRKKLWKKPKPQQ